MKRNSNHPYSEIASFSDFQLEKERLLLKKKLIETSLNLRFQQIGRIFSLSGSILGLVKDLIRPKISGFFDRLMNTKKAD
jgi:hypothetical protein